MQEKVFIRICTAEGDHITDQDVSGFTPEQVDDMIEVKKEFGLVCWVKRVFIKEEV